MILRFIKKYLIPYGITLVVLTIVGLLFLEHILLPFYVGYNNEVYLPDVRGEFLHAGKRTLNDQDFNVEIIDLRSIKPLDKNTIIRSANKTGKLIVVEGDWHSFGIASEIIASVCESDKCKLDKPPVRICYPDSHTPASNCLENEFYINENKIIKAIEKII